MGKGKSDEDPLEAAVRNLANDRGVYRDDLYEALGDKLRGYFGVTGESDLTAVRNRVIKRLRQLVEQDIQPKHRNIAEVSYNTDPTLSDDTRMDRPAGLTPVQVRDHRLGKVFKRDNGSWEYNTARQYFAPHVVVPLTQAIQRDLDLLASAESCAR